MAGGELERLSGWCGACAIALHALQKTIYNATVGEIGG